MSFWKNPITAAAANTPESASSAHAFALTVPSFRIKKIDTVASMANASDNTFGRVSTMQPGLPSL